MIHLSTELRPCAVWHVVFFFDPGFVVMLNVDPGGNDQRDPGTAQRQKKENFVMQQLLWQHGYVFSWTTKVASVDLNEIVSKLAC